MLWLFVVVQFMLSMKSFFVWSILGAIAVQHWAEEDGILMHSFDMAVELILWAKSF